MKTKEHIIIDYMQQLYPNAKAELLYNNNLELLIAVLLSAQATDIQVNKVTKVLFKKYTCTYEYASADIEELKKVIRSLGLYNTKAKNIKNLANIIISKFDNIIPNNLNDLVSLPGVGRKTANVVLSLAFGEPTFAVDTHVERISKRLGLVNCNLNVYEVEKKLNYLFPKSLWSKLHLQFILFGRKICKARKPLCHICKLRSVCEFYKNCL